MNKGTQYYKTDFQIHSPRDKSWTGVEPVFDEDRMAFARRFIAKCRELEIQAVGITDHHDICFIKYFQLAAQETDTQSGFDIAQIVVNPESQNPIIFPGVEVTLSVPCQAIILLDADLEPPVQANLLEALGIGNIHPDAEKKGPEPSQLSIDNFVDLDRSLKEYSSGVLAGKYIILPHVGKDGSHGSLLRDGFYQRYAEMPCVGGYIEHDYDNHNKKSILEGRSRDYGHKALGVFQTSDSREDDFRKLDSRNTWVKLGAPTTEAIRQACLAKQSRISYEPPELPDMFIEKIEVSDSLFLGNLELELNPQYNSIIGGRGTGKTSILEYIRHAMQDQPVSTDPSISDEISQKRERVIDTVKKRNGQIKVHWQKNRVKHIVWLNTQNGELQLSISDGDWNVTSPEEVRNLLPIQAYSQKQLSVVGTRVQELQRFIEQPIQQDLNECDRSIQEKRSEIREIYGTLCQLNNKKKQLRTAETQFLSLQSQVEAIKKTLTKIPPELETALNEHPLRLEEKEAVESIRIDLGSITTAFKEISQQLGDLPKKISLNEKSPQYKILNELFAKTQDVIDVIKHKTMGLGTEWNNSLEEIKSIGQTWVQQHEEHLTKYTTAQEESKESKGKLKKIEEFQNQLASLQKIIAALKDDIQRHQNIQETFNDAWDTWVTSHSQRGDILEDACNKLTEKSDGEIKAKVLRGADIDGPLEKLKSLLSGCSITQDRWLELTSYLKNHPESPAKAWMEIMDQLCPLAELEEKEAIDGATLPTITNWDLTENMRKRILERFDTNNWQDIAFYSLKDKPVFFYCPNRNRKMPFGNASAGQQATALLKVLLKESAGPLIIDQPEDDLDNTVILEIAETIWQAKNKRQIIFSSHDANLVVNGDAELVIQCGYQDEHDKTKGTIITQGAIDIPGVREAITKVMEGGKEAFRLRGKKYGF